jgi:hypothetical protein
LAANVNLPNTPTHGVAENPRGLEIWLFPPHVWDSGLQGRQRIEKYWFHLLLRYTSMAGNMFNDDTRLGSRS